ncbi:MAG: MATE family efflux transporter [Treponema sp.]|nr:MATE family efflux transporter [Treponema sp.]
MQGKSMTEGTPWKHIVRFAFPVLLGSLLQQLYNTVDTIIVGKYSSEAALSAVGTTGSLTFLFLAIAMGFSAGNCVVVAQHYGAKNEKQVRITASSGILFLLLLGVISTIIGLAVSRPAFRYLVAVPDEILDLTLIYFRIYVLGLIFQYGYNIFAAILRAVGDSAATLYFLLISSIANVILDFVFVAGFKWGVTGAAIATDISQLGSFIAAYFYMTKKYPVFKFKLSDYVWNGEAIKKTVKIGTPISLQLVIVSFGLTFIQRAVNEFGQAMTASFTVAQRVEMYINLPCSAMQTTLATYTGQNVGAGRIDRVKKGTHQALFISLIFTFIISALIWIFSQNIVDFFALSEQAAKYCNPHLKTIAFINIILAMYMPLFGVYQGTGHSGIPTIVASCALGVRVTIVYLLRYSSLFGTSIIWWNGLFGFGTGFIVTWIYYLSNKWQNGINEKLLLVRKKDF